MVRNDEGGWGASAKSHLTAFSVAETRNQTEERPRLLGSDSHSPRNVRIRVMGGVEVWAKEIRARMPGNIENC